MIRGFIRNQLKDFKVLILDGDGVWFSGEEYRGILQDGSSIILKSRHHHDGQGLSFLRALGIKILFASSEGEPLMSTINKINALPSVKNGIWSPVAVLGNLQSFNSKEKEIESWLIKEGYTWDDCIYIGDDRSDLEVMRRVPCVAVPRDGRRVVKACADIVLRAGGGRGAIREFAEMVLDVRGINESNLPAA